jgi:hypothetical protein
MRASFGLGVTENLAGQEWTCHWLRQAAYAGGLWQQGGQVPSFKPVPVHCRVSLNDFAPVFLQLTPYATIFLCICDSSITVTLTHNHLHHTRQHGGHSRRDQAVDFGRGAG